MSFADGRGDEEFTYVNNSTPLPSKTCILSEVAGLGEQGLLGFSFLAAECPSLHFMLYMDYLFNPFDVLLEAETFLILFVDEEVSR